MERFFVSGALLALAVVFYLMGSTYGAIVFFIVGAIIELAFWVTVFEKKDAKEERL